MGVVRLLNLVFFLIFTLFTTCCWAASGSSTIKFQHIMAYNNTGTRIYNSKIIKQCAQYFKHNLGLNNVNLHVNYHIDRASYLMSATANLKVLSYILHPLGTSGSLNKYYQFRSDDTPGVTVFFAIRLSDKSTEAYFYKYSAVDHGNVGCEFGSTTTAVH